jgi:hypothetical protein
MDGDCLTDRTRLKGKVYQDMVSAETENRSI